MYTFGAPVVTLIIFLPTIAQKHLTSGSLFLFKALRRLTKQCSKHMWSFVSCAIFMASLSAARASCLKIEQFCFAILTDTTVLY